MANILIMMHPECSHFNSSLGLAHQLIEAGHQLAFLASPADVAWCQKHGMTYHVILKESLRDQPKPKANFFEPLWLQMRREVGQTYEELTQDLDRILEAEKPDLFLVDALTPYAAFAGHAFDIPVLMVQTQLPATWREDVPPINTPLMPPSKAAERREVARIWRRQLRQKSWEQRFKGFAKAYRRMAHLTVNTG